MLRLAILDDYQNVALKFVDWSVLESRGIRSTIFNDTINAATNADALVTRLEPFDIICAMCERTKFLKIS
jgi:hypothetical protein